MKCEVEDPARDLYPLCPLVLELGEVYEIVGNHSEFVGGGVVVAPSERLTFPGSKEQTMGGTHDVVELVVTEIGMGWEDLDVALA